MTKTICVYCSSSEGVSTDYVQATEELGRSIAQRGYTLIFGGGEIGLMGALARAATAGGGRVVGVIPEKLAQLAYEKADEMIITKDLRERKAVMADRADAFIALPGGFGTLEELLEMLTLKQLSFHNKPLVLINTNGFYDPLITLFEQIYARGFTKAVYRSLYHVALDPGDALDYIDSYHPIELPKKWKAHAKKTGEGMMALEDRVQRAAERLLENSSLTDDLNDPEATQLLNWGLKVSRRLVEKTVEMDDEQAEEFLYSPQKNLRRVMRRINTLIAEANADDPDDPGSAAAETLQGILEAVAEVPGLSAAGLLDLAQIADSIKTSTPDAGLSLILSQLTLEGGEHDTQTEQQEPE
jgi:uncharacterized protein (TIGR00730 family)